MGIAAEDKLDHAWPDSGQADGGLATYDVSVPPTYQPDPNGPVLTWPGVKAHDTIYHLNPDNSVLMELFANGEKAPRMHGAVLRIRCRRET
jgi:hypothetical protein